MEGEGTQTNTLNDLIIIIIQYLRRFGLQGDADGFGDLKNLLQSPPHQPPGWPGFLQAPRQKVWQHNTQCVAASFVGTGRHSPFVTSRLKPFWCFLKHNNI